jgi:hypothetical protein
MTLLEAEELRSVRWISDLAVEIDSGGPTTSSEETRSVRDRGCRARRLGKIENPGVADVLPVSVRALLQPVLADLGRQAGSRLEIDQEDVLWPHGTKRPDP